MKERILPRLSKDLINELDESTPHPSLPVTAKGWMQMDPQRVHGLAFAAGYRALVDRLVQSQEEDDLPEGQEDESTGDRPVERYARVLSSDSDIREVSVTDVDAVDTEPS